MRFLSILFIIFSFSAANAQRSVFELQDSIQQHNDSLRVFLGIDTSFLKTASDTLMADTLAILKETSFPKHSSKKAIWLSAALPGLGQAYNRKYWKIPIVYAGFAGLGYCIYFTASNFNGARNAYRDAVDMDPFTNRTYQGISDASTLKSYRDYYNNYLTLSCIFTVVWYGLNLVDAAVDGHLFNYNMSDKLSFTIDPDLQIQSGFTPITSSTIGLKLSLKM